MSVVEHDARDVRSFVLFWICRIVLKTLMRVIPVSDASLGRIKIVDEWAARDARPVRGARVEKAVIAGAPVERITPERLDDPRTAVLYLHGGAFFACGLDSHRAVAAAVARELGATVVNVQYRQCPEAGVGTSVHDGYSVYRAMRDSGEFDAIVVAGDSAGGYIAAKVVEYAARDGLDRPDAYIGFSPLLNLAPSADRSSRRDAMLPIRKIEKLRPFYERGPVPLDGPLDATGDAVAVVFPPAVVVCASGEALEKDAMDLRSSLDRAGVPNEIHLFRGQIHAFPAAVPGSPHTKEAVRASAAFVRRALDADRETESQADSA
ncbi:alpha/beta hydrolase [Gordonia neofelifaecis]|uniref:Alpha/beta hydrolase fold-3 domain protein n=1 Tax=Gordonia neofelifaecis NRRL B-59395 TaxID=644548 RepID=F1YKC8_9ACTN|nr:alpha/beta hydrolase [Gordonia neofelifaecis]EGD54814.1 Alpha/beta hydrolase fold-3 domain protein [Gordonia neofelifaecis NRRL B-59395]